MTQAEICGCEQWEDSEYIIDRLHGNLVSATDYSNYTTLQRVLLGAIPVGGYWVFRFAFRSPRLNKHFQVLLTCAKVLYFLPFQ